jgi:hypothetical protein
MEVILKRFFYSPGFCSMEELEKIKLFLIQYKKFHDLYKKVKGHEPIGFTLDKDLDDVKWYEDFLKQKEKGEHGS